MSPNPKKPASSRSGEDAEAHEERMEDLFRRENNNLRKWLRRKAPPEVVDDLAAESFANVLETDTKPISSLRAYLYRTASNLIASHYREQGANRRKLEGLELEMASASTPSPERLALSEEREDLLNQAIEGLPARCRASFRLHLEGRPNREIVAHFANIGIRRTPWTVRRDINRGYEACRKALEASEETKQESRK